VSGCEIIATGTGGLRTGSPASAGTLRTARREESSELDAARYEYKTYVPSRITD